MSVTLPGVVAAADPTPAELCSQTNYTFFLLPPWYEFLTPTLEGGHCTVKLSGGDGLSINSNEFWLVGLAVVDILLHIGGLIAGGMVIYGGFRYITSQGNPESAKAAKNSIVNAFIGLAIVLVAVGIVKFIAGSFN